VELMFQTSKADRSIELIASEINFFKEQAASGIIEIGKRLIEAKAVLGEDENFTSWLKEKVSFSRSTAYNFIRVANEFNDVQALGRLGQTKVFQLLEIPADLREEFISQPHETLSGEIKTIDDMSTRDLQELIKARKAVDDTVSDLGNKLVIAKSEKSDFSKAEQLSIDLQKAQERITELENKEPKVIEKPVEVEVVPPDYGKLKVQVEALTKAASEARSEALDAKNEAKGYKQYIETWKGGTKSFESLNLIDFKYAVRDFLRHVSPLVYLGEQFAGLKESERQDYSEEVDTIERWINDFRQAIAGNAGGANLIVIEGRTSK
jgi:hypothetical protein